MNGNESYIINFVSTLNSKILSGEITKDGITEVSYNRMAQLR